MKRRDFLKTATAIGMSFTTMPLINCRGHHNQTLGPAGMIPKRTLGKTGVQLSIIGFGGILVRNMDQAMANDLVARAYNQGINYYDIAPSYGNAQHQLGPALKPYRNKCFLACKTLERSRAGAERELHESLKILETDYFDLYQLHALTTVEDVEQAFGPDGAMEAYLKARQEGKVRFIGFSAHSETAALLAMERFAFDTILFPINFVCWFSGNFGPKVVASAREKGMGVLALKSLALGPVPAGTTKPYPKLWYIPVDDDELINLALRFTLSQGTSAAIPPGEETFFWKAVNAAQNFAPITSAESQRLQQIAQGATPLFKAN